MLGDNREAAEIMRELEAMGAECCRPQGGMKAAWKPNDARNMPHEHREEWHMTMQN